MCRVIGIPHAGTNSSYDGEGEVLIDSLTVLAEMTKSPEYLEGALAGERNFIDLKRVEAMATEDHVIVDGPIGSPLVKGIYQLKREDGMSVDEFRKYWIEVHGDLGSKLPGLRRYVAVASRRRRVSVRAAAFRRRRATMVRQR